MWIKFIILFIPFSLFIWKFAPTPKWKLLFIVAGAAGIVLALSGKALKGVTPVGRRF